MDSFLLSFYGNNNPENTNKAKLFISLCQTSNTAEDVYRIMELYEDNNHMGSMLRAIFKNVYNRYIGWALPCKKTINIIFDVWEKQKNSRIIDIGAGSGIFCFMLKNKGIPEDKLIAYDIKERTHESERNFYNITYDVDINKDDILLMTWPYYDINDISFYQKYIDIGGSCIIILGETYGGCTHPESDYFSDNKEWLITSYKVLGAARTYDTLTVNKRINT